VLPDSEFEGLIAATLKGTDYKGLSPWDRAVLYLVAANTGFRVAELASLKSQQLAHVRLLPHRPIPIASCLLTATCRSLSRLATGCQKRRWSELNRRWRICNPSQAIANDNQRKDLGRFEVPVAAPVAGDSRKSTHDSRMVLVNAPASCDEDLAAVVAAWPNLQPAMKAAVRTMVESAVGGK